MRNATAMVVLAALCAGCSDEPADSSRRVWRAQDGVRRVSADVTVASGTTLVIEPGVRVEFAAGASLVVEGELVARGTEAAPIVFTAADSSEDATRWVSVLFKDSAVDARFENLDRYAGGSVLEWCVFEHAQRAVRLDAASPYVHRSVFRNNRTPEQLGPWGGAAMLVENGSRPRIRDCSFEGNEASPFAFGGAVYVKASDPVLQDNLFRNNKATYGGAVSTDLMGSPVVGNRFENNDAMTEGGGISFVSTVSAFLNNRVTGNHALRDGGGVHVCVTCFPHASPFIHDNTITGNRTDAAVPTLGAGGVGAAYLRGFAFNNLHGNLRAGTPSDFGWFHELKEGYPEWVSRPDIGRNWWGTTETAQVAATVFDGADDAKYGTTTAEPLLAEPVGAPSPRVTVTPRNVRYVDGEKTVPMFLTVYNPGPARTVELALDFEPAAGPRAAHDAPLDFFQRSTAGRWSATMPENSVWFASFDASVAGAGPHGTWHATLTDAQTRQALGETCSARVDLSR